VAYLVFVRACWGRPSSGEVEVDSIGGVWGGAATAQHFPSILSVLRGFPATCRRISRGKNKLVIRAKLFAAPAKGAWPNAH